MWLVRIIDKDLLGEPVVGFAFVEAMAESDALESAEPLLRTLRDDGRGRCYAQAEPIRPGTFYRAGRFFPCGPCHVRDYLERAP